MRRAATESPLMVRIPAPSVADPPAAPRYSRWKVDGWWYRELVWTVSEWIALPARLRPPGARRLGPVWTLLVLEGPAD